MCDYCDCRSHPVIASLTEDHTALLAHLADLRRAADADDDVAAGAAVAELHDLLGRHADDEERGVFTQLRATQIDDDYVGRLEHDHHRIHALLDDCGSPGWQHAARDLVALLGAHIVREETDLFPAAHQLLSPDQWEDIERTGARP